MTPSVSATTSLNTIPDAVRVDMLAYLDRKSLNLLAATSRTWGLFVKRKLIDEKIPGWMGHLWKISVKTDPILNEKNLRIRQDEFIDRLKGAKTAKTQDLIDRRDPLFMLCMHEYLRRNPSHKPYFEIPQAIKYKSVKTLF